MEYTKFLESIKNESIYIESLKQTLHDYIHRDDLSKEYVKRLIDHIDKNRETRTYFTNISHFYLKSYVNFYQEYYTDKYLLKQIIVHFMEDLAQTSGLFMFFYNKCIKMNEINIDDDFFKNYIEISDIFCEINSILLTILKN